MPFPGIDDRHFFQVKHLYLGAQEKARFPRVFQNEFGSDALINGRCLVHQMRLRLNDGVVPFNGLFKGEFRAFINREKQRESRFNTCDLKVLGKVMKKTSSSTVDRKANTVVCG
jgi:hypothetical protein